MPRGTRAVPLASDAPVIARRAGFEVPPDTRVLVVRLTRVGRDVEPLSIEKLSPVLGFYVEDGWRACCLRAIQVLELGGLGHSLAIHSMDDAVMIPIGISPRYALLTDDDWRALFGAERQAVLRELRQPGQLAYQQTVRVLGPRGELDRVRILGPFRQRSRAAISLTDARRLGIDAPVRLPGDFRDAPAATLVGPAGSRTAPIVVPAAHLHLSADRAAALGLRDGDRVAARCGKAGRAVTFHDLCVYAGEQHRPELHLDADEANAAGVRTGALAMLADLPATPAGHAPAARARRPLVTERDVDAFAARGEILSRHSPYLVTPAARDRARDLGIWREQP